MAPSQLYSGPKALGHSIYASPTQGKTALAAIPPILSPYTAATDNTIATKEQIAATVTATGTALATVPLNPDADLAVTQGNALKEEVDKYASKFSRTMSSAVINTRRLLELIRESLQEENTVDMKAVDDLWAELEQLFVAANEAKVALPNFLEKQRNNLGLYHTSMMHETIRETQQELNIQHKKVNIQHNLILEHQEAFQFYKEQTAAKIKELEDLQERVSRLTLEKGNFRTEIDKYKRLLEKEKAIKVENLHKADSLQKELETLLNTNGQLVMESNTLRKTLDTLQEKMKTAEQHIEDRFTAELKAKSDALAKETKKTTSLSVEIGALRGGENIARLEADKVKLENKSINEKYKIQSLEHAKAFTTLNEQTKKVHALLSDVARFQGEIADMKQRLAKTSELQKQNTELLNANSDLLKQANSLTSQFHEAKDDSNRAKTELIALSEKVDKLNEVIKNLEIEKNEIHSKQAEDKEALENLSTLKNENLNLKATLNEFKAKSSSLATSFLSEGEKKAFEEKISGLEEKKTELEASLQEWTHLAQLSYDEYKAMLPLYKQAEQYRKDALNKDGLIKNLKLELHAVQALQSNSVNAVADAAYWKDKYESLLSTVGG